MASSTGGFSRPDRSTPASDRMSVVPEIVSCPGDVPTGTVAFEALVPLRSPLHVAGLVSNQEYANQEYTARSFVPPSLSNKISPLFLNVIETAPILEIIPVEFLGPLSWRGLCARANVFKRPEGTSQRYVRPGTYFDWELLTDLLASEKDKANKRHWAFVLGPVLSIFVLAFVVGLFQPTVLQRLIFGLGCLFFLSASVLGILLNPTFDDGEKIDPEKMTFMDKYTATSVEKTVQSFAFSAANQKAEEYWQALTAHATETGIPILNGDMLNLRAIAKKV